VARLRASLEAGRSPVYLSAQLLVIEAGWRTIVPIFRICQAEFRCGLGASRSGLVSLHEFLFYENAIFALLESRERAGITKIKLIRPTLSGKSVA